jgi:hypothetical protein
LLSRCFIVRFVGLHQRGAKRFWSLLFLSVAINAGVFFLVPRAPEPPATAKPYRLSQLVPEALNRSILSCEYDQVRFDQAVKRRYFAQIRKHLWGGNCPVVLLQRELLGERLNFRVLEYYLRDIPVYAVAGLSDPAPGFHHALSVLDRDFPEASRRFQPGKAGKPAPTLAISKDHVLLLHSRSLHVEVSGKDGSTWEVVAEDRNQRSDVYQIYILSLTPTSSVDVTSGRQTISIVE